jgi:hypothetical protein
VRRERTGSIEAALRAGRKLATKATKETMAMTPKYVAGLLDVMPYERLFINRTIKSRPSHQLTRMQERGLVERCRTDGKTVLVTLTKLGREKLDAARPIHAASVRRNLLSRLSQEQIDTIVRVSNLLGEED